MANEQQHQNKMPGCKDIFTITPNGCVILVVLAVGIAVYAQFCSGYDESKKEHDDVIYERERKQYERQQSEKENVPSLQDEEFNRVYDSMERSGAFDYDKEAKRGNGNKTNKRKR